MNSVLDIHRLIFVLYFALAPSAGVAADRLLLLHEPALAATKSSLIAGTASPATQAAYSSLLTHAEKLLVLANPSVMDKTSIPPSGDKHDYLSLSRYWWPNPDTEDGLPWIRKDGLTNPGTQTDAVDRVRFGNMAKAVRILALAYYFSNHEAYAQKAASLLHTWFLDEKTRMNPHLQYAQSVPGKPRIRPTGILDGRLISTSVLDAVALLSGSRHWSNDDDARLNRWLGEYLDWLTDSQTGKMGARQKNNHGSWYRFQVAALAYYLGDTRLVSATIEAAKRSLDNQLDRSGGQPYELARTRSFSYSCFNLEALTGIAIIGEKAGIPFWEYQSREGKSLFSAIDYLLPVASGEAWPHPTAGIELSRLALILARIPQKYLEGERDEALQIIITDISSAQTRSGRARRVLEEFALLNTAALQARMRESL